ncbi:MAG: macro domain-containing protein [Clostridia bacterium]|nr:macro domain-containing protein [Clostridia bacterium]
MPFSIIRNDITKVTADAVVNTANPKPVVGGGTDTAVYRAAGKRRLLAQRKQIGDVAPGQAVRTDAFRLPAKHIIHTVGPVWQGGGFGERDVLRACYANSLALAVRQFSRWSNCHPLRQAHRR